MHRTLIAVVVVFAAFGVFGASTARGAETREISGTVYIDSNLNGVRDAGEKGAGGRTVEVEDSQAGTLQATTASDGRYHFENVPVDGGNMIHVLTEEKAPCADDSWRPLSPEDDWSNIDIAAAEGEGEITGTIVNDVNENGRHDPGEPGEAGWSLMLQGGPQEGAVSCNATITSTADGSFRFRGLPPGSYSVMVGDAPGGLSKPWEYTYPTQANETYPQLLRNLFDVDLPAGTKSVRYEFGVHELQGTGTISADTFIDKNANEVRDPGEPLAECWRTESINLYRFIADLGFVYVMIPSSPTCNDGVSSLAGLPAGAWGIWYPWWCTNPEQAGPPSHPNTPTMATLELPPGGSIFYGHGKCGSDWVAVETATPFPSSTATPSAEMTVMAPNVGEGADERSNDSSAFAFSALLGATTGCGAGVFALRKLRRKA